MSFLFKSKQRGAASSALPPASRDIRSSDGPASQIPTLNGAVNGAKPVSPTPPSTSVNNSLNSLAGNGNALKPAPLDEKAAYYQNDAAARDAAPSSPELKALRAPDPVHNSHSRMRSSPIFDSELTTTQQMRGPPVQTTRPATAPTDSPYPWSQRRLAFTVSHVNPFPRYGAAANSTSSKDGAIYLMGGLINGSTVKGDLWMVEAGNGSMSCYPVATTSEGPGPRVGHASLLVGNAFIVFGGDTKMDEGDQLDDTLYLLNTCKAQIYKKQAPSRIDKILQQRSSGQERYLQDRDRLDDTATR